MEFVMLFFSAIIIVCIVGNKLSARIGVPSLLIFLALGMICGSDGILKLSLIHIFTLAFFLLVLV